MEGWGFVKSLIFGWILSGKGLFDDGFIGLGEILVFIWRLVKKFGGFELGIWGIRKIGIFV